MDKQVTISLPVGMIHQILEILHKVHMPYEVSAPIIHTIAEQLKEPADEDDTPSRD